MRVPRGTLVQAPKPTHGNGSTSTDSLEPLACRKCAAVLVVIWDIDSDAGEAVHCPNHCEDCV